MNPPHIVALVIVVAAYAIAGTLDYNDARRRADQTKAQRLAEGARIWSKRCEHLNKDALVKQADGGRFEIHCIPRRVLTVAEGGQ